jgi:hypothetical protein
MFAAGVVAAKALLGIAVFLSSLACLFLPVIAVSVLLLHRHPQDNKRKKP